MNNGIKFNKINKYENDQYHYTLLRKENSNLQQSSYQYQNYSNQIGNHLQNNFQRFQLINQLHRQMLSDLIQRVKYKICFINNIYKKNEFNLFCLFFFFKHFQLKLMLIVLNNLILFQIDMLFLQLFQFEHLNLSVVFVHLINMKLVLLYLKQNLNDVEYHLT